MISKKYSQSLFMIIMTFTIAPITLVFNLVVLFVGLLIGSAMFGNNNDYWIVVSLILVVGISYFRFKGS